MLIEKIVNLELKSKKYRKNLLFIRGGRKSLHRQFYTLPTERSWDVLFTTYESLYDIDFEQVEFLVYGKLSKWQDLSYLADRIIDKYEYVWVTDDDINLVSANNISRAFDIAEIYKLDICQPSLSARSYCSWRICKNSPSSLIRFTTFVECMTPIFSKSALTTLKDDISNAISGCGLDLIFWHALGKPINKIGVIDAIQVEHLKPIDTEAGLFYQHLRANGINPKHEVNYFLEKYSLKEAEIYVTGFIPFIERHSRFVDLSF